jgi:GON domain
MTGRAALLVLWVAACSFQAQAVTIDAAPPAADASVDMAPPITCGDLTCDPNATCKTTGPAACQCKGGYSGNGMTCSDIDECAMANGGCQAACQNTPGSVVCYAPATCADVKAHVPAAADGPYMLYLTADAGKPWPAFCAAMATTPLEYLSLTGANSSQYTAGGGSPGTSVKTTYTKVRFDPAAGKIDISDRRFATSQGMLNHSGDNMMVTSMPFGVAMDCLGNNSTSGVALIDLSATKFALTGTSAFAEGGNMSKSIVQLTSNNQRATINGGGNCGWAAPAGAPVNPFNNNVTSGVILGVVYLP